MSQVYVELTADFLHPGHINIINEARKLGEVTVGLLTDEAVANYKRKPLLNYEQRTKILENINGVSKIIPQETHICLDNIKKLKPEFVVHGDEWGNLSWVREKVIELLKEWGGKLVEPKFTGGVSATELIQKVEGKGTSADKRLRKLRDLLKLKDLVRIMEVHNGLTGLIVEKTKVKDGNGVKEFDGMWESSLTDSVSKGKPDIAAVDVSSRVNTIEQILETTTKPMIVDVDNGGLPEHFVYTVRTMERLGVSAVILEDKRGAKRNSLFGINVRQEQEDVEDFCDKIRAGKRAQIGKDFMVIARIESLILKKGLHDALIRANAYICAGADGIMIHSKEEDPSEILEFCKEYDKLPHKVPLVAVPSTYDSVTEEELKKAGIRIVIYANHLLRSAYPAMKKTAESILQNGRAKEADENCMSIKDILDLIPDNK